MLGSLFFRGTVDGVLRGSGAIALVGVAKVVPVLVRLRVAMSQTGQLRVASKQ